MLHPETVTHIEAARTYISQAVEASHRPNSSLVASIHSAIMELEKAERSMVKTRGPSEAGGFEAAKSDLSSPSEISLEQNYPNPFAASTVIRYWLQDDSDVRLVIYDAEGREVYSLVDRKQPAGRHEVEFRPHHLPSGVYMYRLEAGSNVRSRTLTLVK